MAKKVFVEVIAKFSREGQVMPISVIWQDGRVYEIDKILDVRRAASLKVGGMGIRYTCRIGGKDTFLYYEEPKWFVEGRE